MGAFIAFSTQDSLWGQILFTFFGIWLAASCSPRSAKSFVGKPGRGVTCAAADLCRADAGAPEIQPTSDVCGECARRTDRVPGLARFFDELPGAAAPGRLALAIELGCFAALAALLILGTADIGFLRPITWKAPANLSPRRSPRRCPWLPCCWFAE